MTSKLTYLLGVLILSYSCTEVKPDTDNEAPASRETLNLNYDENIINLDTTKQKNAGEEFVSQLIESSQYRIKVADDDILYQLEALGEKSIQSINIRFIKNPNTVLTEFESRNLDILTVSSYDADTVMTSFLEKIRSDKYSDYNCYPGRYGVVQSLLFMNFSDSSSLSNALKLVMETTGSTDSSRRADDNSEIVKPLVLLDSAMVYWKVSGSGADTLKKGKTRVVKVNEEILLEGTPLIVSSEDHISFISESKRTISDQLLDDLKNKGRRVDACLVIKIYPEYFITHSTIGGFKDYGGKLHDQLEQLYFKKIHTY